jgi:hypothetical protein
MRGKRATEGGGISTGPAARDMDSPDYRRPYFVAPLESVIGNPIRFVTDAG